MPVIAAETTAPSSLPCCSNQQAPWPARMPANLHVINPGPECSQSKYGNVGKRCVGAQTEKEVENVKVETIEEAGESAMEVPTESPDEGYEGEPPVVV